MGDDDNRVKATVPAYDLVLAQAELPWSCDAPTRDRMVRRALITHGDGMWTIQYPAGRMFTDCATCNNGIEPCNVAR